MEKYKAVHFGPSPRGVSGTRVYKIHLKNTQMRGIELNYENSKIGGTGKKKIIDLGSEEAAAEGAGGGGGGGEERKMGRC